MILNDNGTQNNTNALAFFTNVPLNNEKHPPPFSCKITIQKHIFDSFKLQYTQKPLSYS